MEAVNHEPQTLQEAIIYFSDQENCLNYLVAHRPEWKNGVVCPRCGSTSVGFLSNQLRWQCSARHPKRQFSVKVGTIMEDSPIGLEKWLPATWMILNAKNGISSCEIARALGVTQKTAWFMLHRIRLAQQGKQGGKLGGEVEVDETFIGGRARNMHKSRKLRKLGGARGGVVGKIAVQGLLERHGEVRTRVVGEIRKRDLVDGIREHVEPGTNLYTDDVFVYDGIEDYNHQVINHAEKYVDGQIHTNGLENFWSLLKRGINGTYISVEPFHLFRYVDEQAFRFNNRKLSDAERFELGVRKIVGKRLTYAELTGKVDGTETIN
jgi:transposase-like protein